MRKLFLLLLLLPLWGQGGFAAVQVKTIATNYAAKTVTFSVSWVAGTRNATHLSKVWVFVDYQEVTNPNTTGAWQRATVDLSKLPAGGSADGANTNGFWYQGQATAAQSATITVALTNVPAKFNWCAYATDYPPNVTATGGTYTLHGTAPFTLVAADGVSTQVVNGNSIAASALTVTPVTIRDATGCPGVFCIYTGADLYIDATHICRQRTSGAQNWEAWIKDARDNEYYRVVLMPDNKWWLAQNVKYAGTGSAISGCTKDECGRAYTAVQAYSAWGGSSGSIGNVQGVCPSGWYLPTASDYSNMVNSIKSSTTNNTNALVAACLRPASSSCSPKNDCFGWASIRCVYDNGTACLNTAFYYTNDTYRDDGFSIDYRPGGTSCGTIYGPCSTCDHDGRGAVRCFRAL